MGSYKGLKICFIVTAILLVIISATIAILYLTVFKPKEPQILSQTATLQNFKLMVIPYIDFNITLGITVTINNRNYGSFTYQNSTTYVTYHNKTVAEAPAEADTIPARGMHNFTSSLEVLAGKILSMPDFNTDFANGVFNFTSSSTLHGVVKVFKIIKAKATTYTSCDMSLFYRIPRIDAVCHYKVSL